MPSTAQPASSSSPSAGPSLIAREHTLFLRELDLSLLRQGRAEAVAVDELPLEQHHRERVLDLALDEPLQRTGAEGRVEALLGERVQDGVVDLERDAAVLEPLAEK